MTVGQEIKMDSSRNTDEIRFRRVKTGEGVLCGPADEIEAAVVRGTKLTVHRKSGPPRHLVPLRAGSRFVEDGIEKCYGYTSVRDRREDAPQRCPSCDSETPSGAKFCPQCGESISSKATNDFQTEGV